MTGARRTQTARLAMLGILLGMLGCSANPAPASDGEPDSDAEPRIAETNDVPEGEGSRIPVGFVPPPGRCRVWIPGQPSAEREDASPVGQCSTLRATIPAGAWLIYRPTDHPERVRVWQYGAEREVLAQRIYDAASGELIRHVAPAGH